ncbi:MAG: Stp1/IreP family PP2C-type Ser/Thr phosphatase [Firmicutes bacterium]|nr:Stp1/IreP family PP2C-type Ser/Thr phosphatase [Bacillota bacterium]
MESAAITHRGLVRSNNEDSFLALPEIGLFAVADGMGGHLAGEVASRLALEILKNSIRTERNIDPLSELLNAVKEANRQVYYVAQTSEEYGGMGTTLTTCLIQESVLYWVHIGDSRGYLVREGEINQFTQDHSLVSDYVRDGKLTAEEAEIHPYRNVLSRALGPEPTVMLDSGTISIKKGDIVVLCTDGLTAHLTDKEILEVVQDGPLTKQAKQLLELALKRGGRDNVTCVLVRVSGSS